MNLEELVNVITTSGSNVITNVNVVCKGTGTGNNTGQTSVEVSGVGRTTEGNAVTVLVSNNRNCHCSLSLDGDEGGQRSNLNGVVSTDGKKCSCVGVFGRSEVGGQERTVEEGTSDSTSTVENRLTSQGKGERWVVVLVTGLPDKGNFQSGVSNLYIDVKVKTKLEKVTGLTLSEVKGTVSSGILEVTTIYLSTEPAL